MGEKQREARTDAAAESDDRKQGLPATFTGDTSGAGAITGSQSEEHAHGDDARLPPPARDLPRTATQMAPGIPVGSGQGIDEALQQPDSEIGGGVAGDTTPGGKQTTPPLGGPGGAGEQERKLEIVRSEDKDRTTL